MASTGKRDDDNGDCLKMKFMAETPHFFKIILEPTLREGKLRIPKKFAKRYGEGMQSPVVLNIPGGAVWQVELRNSDDEVWLGDGWKEFAEHYSLNCGHFVVFRYEGNGQFHVVIFDMSASEIEYPYDRRHGGDPVPLGKFPGHNQGRTEDDNSLEIPSNMLASRKIRGRSSPCPMAHNMMRTDSTNKVKRNSIPEALVPDFRSDSQPSRGVQLEKSSGNGNSSLIKQEDGGELKDLIPKNGSSTSPAAEAATKFVSSYPFFKVVVPASNFGHGCMHIPLSFRQKHIKQSERVVMLDFADRLWPVKLFHYPKCCKFSAGWYRFCKENNLQAGDICVFELRRRSHLLLKVSIFRLAAS